MASTRRHLSVSRLPPIMGRGALKRKCVCPYSRKGPTCLRGDSASTCTKVSQVWALMLSITLPLQCIDCLAFVSSAGKVETENIVHSSTSSGRQRALRPRQKQTQAQTLTKTTTIRHAGSGKRVSNARSMGGRRADRGLRFPSQQQNVLQPHPLRRNMVNRIKEPSNHKPTARKQDACLGSNWRKTQPTKYTRTTTGCLMFCDH